MNPIEIHTNEARDCTTSGKRRDRAETRIGASCIYSDDKSLRRGAGFRTIELNGAASEATHRYDARNSRWSTYRTLYRQWNLIYAIGAENRKRGARPRPVLSVWRYWRDSSLSACELPIAD